jgi:hypothetical protein
MTQRLHMPGLGPLAPSQPFEWDRDQPVLLASTAATFIPRQPRGFRKWRSVLLSTALGAVFLAGIALERGLWQNVLPRYDLAGDFVARAVATDLLSSDILPQELVIYDLAQYRRFAYGLGQMKNDDLHAYAAAVRGDLHVASRFMAPFHKDALFVIEAELAKRQAQAPAPWFSAP